MRALYAVGLFLAGLLAHWWWCTYLPFYGLAPQLLLVLTLAVASQYGPVAGQCYGFFWGLFLDALDVHLFGANALLLTGTAYLVGAGRRQMDMSTPASQAAMTAILSLLYFVALAGLGLVFQRQAFWAGWAALLVIPVYNGLLAPVLFSLAERALRPTARPW